MKKFITVLGLSAILALSIGAIASAAEPAGCSSQSNAFCWMDL
ncbi:hypothetical protein SK066_08020 [Paenibacillus hunanensis]|nr:hypothetical protein [Paenibacillus hunanensis]WPP42871.1 hypothetical protein SK066_08020 [Paenibacillus hunanensis]